MTIPIFLTYRDRMSTRSILLTLRVRYYFLIELRNRRISRRWDWAWMPLPKLRTTITTVSLMRVVNTIGLSHLSLPSTLLKLLFLNLLSMSHKPRNVHFLDQYGGSILLYHQFRDSENKFTHPSFTVRAYLEIWVNFKAYFFTLIFPCVKLTTNQLEWKYYWMLMNQFQY